MKTCYIGLGSNVGDRYDNLREARELLVYFVGDLLLESSIYETEPWGNLRQDVYLNQVVAINTFFEAAELLLTLQQIEDKMGRERTTHWGPRIIDLDILYFGTDIYDTRELQIPHSQLPFRRFVLMPLAEIAPDFVHPGLHKTNEMLLRECKDKSGVKLF